MGLASSENLSRQITQIAGIFEKKEINKKYTPDVLMSFIKDKASKLLKKVDTLDGELKVL